MYSYYKRHSVVNIIFNSIDKYMRINPLIIVLVTILSLDVNSANFSVSFKDVDIKEFINTVSKNINKTIIIDPKVQGLVSIRSYELLDEEKYYQFFLNVLDVYGYAVVEMPNNILKIIPSRRAKNTVSQILSEADETYGDEIINRILNLKIYRLKI